MHMVFGLQSHDNRTQRDKGAKGQRKKSETEEREREEKEKEKNLCAFAPLPLCVPMPIFAPQLNDPIFSTYEAFKIFI